MARSARTRCAPIATDASSSLAICRRARTGSLVDADGFTADPATLRLPSEAPAADDRPPHRAGQRRRRRVGRAGASSVVRVAGHHHGDRARGHPAATARERRRCRENRSGLHRRPKRRPRRVDLGLSSRRRVRLHAGARGRHARQRLRRRIRFLTAALRRRRAGRGRARPAKRGLRKRRHRRDRVGDDEARRIADRLGLDRRRLAGDGPRATAGGRRPSASGRSAAARSTPGPMASRALRQRRANR